MARPRRRQERAHRGASSSGSPAKASASESRRRRSQQHRRRQPPQQHVPSSLLLLLVPLALALLLARATPAAAFFITPPQRRPPPALPLALRRPRAASGTARGAITTSTSSSTAGSSTDDADSSSNSCPPPASTAAAAAAASSSSSLLRVRRATRADLRRVATMQVMEYGGQGLAFLWHYLQELDRLQTSFWVDPAHHAMLVVEDSTTPNPSPTTSTPASTVPFGALGALLLGDPRVVGFVDLDARDRRVDRSTPPPYLSDLIVDPARRGRGLGRLLMTEAEAVAEAWGFPGVYLKVRKSNVRGLALYGALGYAVVGEAGEEGILTMRKWVVEESEERAEEERRLLAAAASIMAPFFFDPTWTTSRGREVEGEGEGAGEEASQ